MVATPAVAMSSLRGLSRRRLIPRSLPDSLRFVMASAIRNSRATGPLMQKGRAERRPRPGSLESPCDLDVAYGPIAAHIAPSAQPACAWGGELAGAVPRLWMSQPEGASRSREGGCVSRRAGVGVGGALGRSGARSYIGVCAGGAPERPPDAGFARVHRARWATNAASPWGIGVDALDRLSGPCLGSSARRASCRLKSPGHVARDGFEVPPCTGPAEGRLASPSCQRLTRKILQPF